MVQRKVEHMDALLYMGDQGYGDCGLQHGEGTIIQ